MKQVSIWRVGAALLALTLLASSQGFAATKASRPGVPTGTSKSFPAGPAAEAPVVFDGARPTAKSMPALSDEILDGFTATKRSRDGKEETIELPARLKAMLKAKRADFPQSAQGKGKLARVTDTAEPPYSAIGFINNTVCSGAIVLEKYVLTSAYCVWSTKDQKFLKLDHFFPGYDGKSAPFGSVPITNVWIPDGFKKKGDLAFDFALLELEESPADNTGFFGMAANDGAADGVLILAGHPFEGVEPKISMWQTECKQQGADRGFLFYKCAGKSAIVHTMYGSPLVRKADDGWYVAGFHEDFQTDSKNSFFGIQITDAMTAVVKNWAGQGDDDAGDDEEIAADCTCEQ